MSRKCIKVFLLSVFWPSLSWCQTGTLSQELAFVRHLRIQKLYNERMFVLHQLTDTSAQLDLEKAWTHHAAGKPDSALFYYNQIAIDTIISNGFYANYSGLLFKTFALERLHLEQQHPTLPHDDMAMKRIGRALDLMSLNYTADEALPEGVSLAYVKYRHVKRKSGFLAGSYSLVIPGMGKLYYGQKRQARNMFLANAALGLQAFESYRKAGVSSPRFIIFGGMFSIFYISNIYGTIKGLKKAKRDHKLQLHHEIVNYYFNNTAQYPGKY